MVASELPINISVSKMLDWLVDRNHCNIKWRKTSLAAHRAAIDAVDKSRDDQDLAKYLKEYGITWSDDIDYFVVHLINQYLLETDGGSSWMGIGSTARAKLWDSVFSLYKKENAHLAEAASIITRLVQKERPSLLRNIQKIHSKMEESTVRVADLNKAAKASLTRYSEACEKILINDVDNPKTQLLKGLSELAPTIRRISNLAVSLEDACTYYTNYSAYTCQNDGNRLKHLAMLCNNPQCTVYEFLNGKKPSHIIRDVMNDVFDIGVEEDITADTYDMTVESDKEDYAIEIVDDFEIVMESSDIIEVETSNCDDNGVLISHIVAKGDDAKYVLEKRETRELVLNDLAELEYFLFGIENNSTSLLPSYLRSASTTTWLEKVRGIKAELENETVVNLLLLSNDSAEADRISDEITKHKVMANRKMQKKEELIRESDAMIIQLADLEKQIVFITKRVGVLKDFLQNMISEKYNNRPVIIQGFNI